MNNNAILSDDQAKEELERIAAKIRACPHDKYNVEWSDQARFAENERLWMAKCQCGLVWTVTSGFEE